MALDPLQSKLPWWDIEQMSVAQAARVGSPQTVEAALLQPSADVNWWGCQLLLWLADMQISMKHICLLKTVDDKRIVLCYWSSMP